MKKVILMIMLLFILFTITTTYAEVSYTTNILPTTNVEYVEPSDPYDFSDEPLIDEETAKLEKEREAYEKKNVIEKAVYNRTNIIFAIIIILVIVVVVTVIFVKLNRKRWK